MSKYVLFGIIMAWLLFATFLVNAFDVYLDNDDFGVENPIDDVAVDGDDGTIDSARGFLKTFTSAVSFQVTGLPAIVSLFLFTIPTFILAYMTLELLIKFLSAIIPF